MLADAEMQELDEILSFLPQTVPFRFVDHVVELDELHVKATYRFRGDEFFYAGHFRDAPITPGVILLETMAQGGVVIQALYLLRQSEKWGHILPRTFLTDIQAEFRRPVRPPEVVTICSELLLWRAGKIRSNVKLLDSNSGLIASATVSGMGVFID
jgi:3-hydroxyacyl-[acyl-carrier-protein] dehydratase